MRGITRSACGVPLIVGLALTGHGCGGGVSVTTPFTPTPVATPRPQVTSVVDEGSITDLAANDGWFLGFTLTGSGTGTIAVIVDWTFASNDVDVYLAEAGACSGHFFPDECSFVNSAGSLAKPERIEAPDLRAGEYQVLIINWGTTTEAVSYQILLTTSAGTSSGRGLLSVVQASGPHGEYLREGAES